MGTMFWYFPLTPIWGSVSRWEYIPYLKYSEPTLPCRVETMEEANDGGGIKTSLIWIGIEKSRYGARGRETVQIALKIKEILHIRNYLIYDVTRTNYCTQYTNYDPILVCNLLIFIRKTIKNLHFHLWIYILILIRVKIRQLNELSFLLYLFHFFKQKKSNFYSRILIIFHLLTCLLDQTGAIFFKASKHV